MPFRHHPTGLFLTLSALSALILPLALVIGTDPVGDHLRLGLFGMGGAAVIGYVAAVPGGWAGRPRAVPAGPLALLWLMGRALALVWPEVPLVWAPPLALVATALALAGARAPARRHRLLSTVPLGLVLAEVALVAGWITPAALTLALPALIVLVGGRALPAFALAEVKRRGGAARPMLPAWPAALALIASPVQPLACLLFAAGWTAVLAGQMLAALPRPDPANALLQIVWALIPPALIARALDLAVAPHLLTMGVAGAMILVFAARATMRRQTGAALLPRRWHWAGLALILAATAARAGASVWPANAPALLLLSAGLWQAGWAAFLAAHLPALARPAPAPVFSARSKADLPAPDGG